MTNVARSGEPSVLELNSEDDDNGYIEIRRYMAKEPLQILRLALALKKLSAQIF